MKTVPVRLVKTLDQSYVIRIGRSIFERELTNVVGEISPTGVAVVLDSNLERLYAKRVEKLLQAFGIPARLISFPAGEKNKHLGTVTKLFTKLARSGLDRRTLIVALGGGVTGDIAGFLASLALRGIPFVQVPTSLLAMTDSSIGGKTGVDTPEGKNLIGAFYQPKAVIIDTEFLDTLPEREYINGMAEVVKHGLIADAAYFDKLEESADRILGRDYDWMTEIIARSCEIKARVVENDERETGLRQTLNFGHTVGHAVENASHFRIPHGYAVALGMVAEMSVAVERGLLDAAQRDRAVRLLERLGLLGYRSEIARMDPRKFSGAAGMDKKNVAGAVHVVLLRSIGSVLEEQGKYSFSITDGEMARAVSSIR